MLDYAGALHSRRGVSVQIQNDPLVSVLRLENGESDGFIVMAEHHFLPFVLGLVQHKGFGP